jgi:hypothetical protein
LICTRVLAANVDQRWIAALEAEISGERLL